LDRISFGVVSYGFLNSKTLTLTNTSEANFGRSVELNLEEFQGFLGCGKHFRIVFQQRDVLTAFKHI